MRKKMIEAIKASNCPNLQRTMIYLIRERKEAKRRAILEKAEWERFLDIPTRAKREEMTLETETSGD